MLVGNDNKSNDPWSIKKRQLTAIRETVQHMGGMEDLEICVPLKEYFRV